MTLSSRWLKKLKVKAAFAALKPQAQNWNPEVCSRRKERSDIAKGVLLSIS